MKSLKEKFKEKVVANSDITIILDSLDQLIDHGAGLKDWIPKVLPSDVTMIISAIPGEQFKVCCVALIFVGTVIVFNVLGGNGNHEIQVKGICKIHYR